MSLLQGSCCCSHAYFIISSKRFNLSLILVRHLAVGMESPVQFAGVIALVCFWSHYPSYPFIDAASESAILQTDVCVANKTESGGLYPLCHLSIATCLTHKRGTIHICIL